ncbi:MAG: hypothetical protein WCJ97_07885 [Phycisphaerae bacterium]
MWHKTVLTTLAVLSLAGQLSAQATQPSANPMADTVKLLGAEDYQTREVALQQLQKMIAEQTRLSLQTEALLQEMQKPVTKQMKTLMGAQGEEATSRCNMLIQTQVALGLLAEACRDEPLAKRQKIVDWACDSKRIGMISQLFGAKRQTMLQAIKDLAADEGEVRDWLMAYMIRQPNDIECLPAIAALWETKKPANVIVDALLDRALLSAHRLRTIGAIQTVIGPADEQVMAGENTVKIEMPGLAEPVEYYDNVNDAGFNAHAAALLMRLDSPLVKQRLQEILAPKYLQSGVQGLNDSTQGWFYKLLVQYKITEAAPLLVPIACNAEMNYAVTEGDGRYLTPRLDALATLVQLLDKNPEDYGLSKHGDDRSGRADMETWMAESKAGEVQSVRKFWTYLKENAKALKLPAPRGKMPEEVKDEGEKAEDPNKPEQMPIPMRGAAVPVPGAGVPVPPVQPRMEAKP